MLLLIIPLTCPVFFLSKQIFCYKFLTIYESQSSNFVYTLRVAKDIEGQKAKLRFILPYFAFFSISHSNVLHREICDKYFCGTIAHRILYKCCESFLFYVKEKQISSTYSSLHFSFSPVFKYKKKNHLSFLRD